MKRSASENSLDPKVPKEVDQHFNRVRQLLMEIKDYFQSILREIIVEILRRNQIIQNKDPKNFVKEA